jgi:hypothetical protein
MNERTVVAVCCYQGDSPQVVNALEMYKHHGCPLVILSPKDSPVEFKGIKAAQFGRRAYIGQDSLDRQRFYMKYLLDNFSSEFFLFNDSDSFCVSARIPDRLYSECESTLWSNEVTEPRPHESPYPKLAFQPPYFFNRESLVKMLAVAERVRAHPITPYVDWWMNAVSAEAGVKHRPFTDLEHVNCTCMRLLPEEQNDSWKVLDFRIRYHGTVMQHPIKTPEQVRLCVEARKVYEQTYPKP